jgi:hypothetical protein
VIWKNKLQLLLDIGQLGMTQNNQQFAAGI